jgi:hypothetical protein
MASIPNKLQPNSRDKLVITKSPGLTGPYFQDCPQPHKVTGPKIPWGPIFSTYQMADLISDVVLPMGDLFISSNIPVNAKFDTGMDQ